MKMIDDESCESGCVACALDSAPAPYITDPVDRPRTLATKNGQTPICAELPVWSLFALVAFLMLTISDTAGLTLVWGIGLIGAVIAFCHHFLRQEHHGHGEDPS